MDTKLFFELLGYDYLRKKTVDILTSANCLLIQNVSIITHMQKMHNNVPEHISQHISENKTFEKSFENIASFLNKLPNATAVANVAAPAVTPDAAVIDKSALTKKSADQLFLQLTHFESSIVLSALSIFVPSRMKQRLSTSPQPGPSVSGIYTIEPVAHQRGGTQRY